MWILAGENFFGVWKNFEIDEENNFHLISIQKTRSCNRVENWISLFFCFCFLISQNTGKRLTRKSNFVIIVMEANNYLRPVVGAETVAVVYLLIHQFEEGSCLFLSSMKIEGR